LTGAEVQLSTYDLRNGSKRKNQVDQICKAHSTDKLKHSQQGKVIRTGSDWLVQQVNWELLNGLVQTCLLVC